MNIYKKLTLLISLFLLLSCFVSSADATGETLALAPAEGAALAQQSEKEAPSKKEARILVISSFQLSHAWTDGVCDAIDRAFVESRDPMVVDYLILNKICNQSGSYQDIYQAYLARIQRGEYDMVVAILDDAIQLVLETYSSLPAQLPIVLVNQRNCRPDFKQSHPNVTGFQEVYALRSTVQGALQLYPNTQEVVLIFDSSQRGSAFYEQAGQELRDFPQCKLTLLDAQQLSRTQVLERVKALSSQAILVFGPWPTFAENHHGIGGDTMGEEVAVAAQRPYFTLTDSLLAHGALGGDVAVGTLVGERLVALMDDILRTGIPVEKIDFEPIPSRWVVDMKEFRRANLNRKFLPPSALLLNDQKAFYREHPKACVLGGVAMLVLLVLLGGNLVQYRRFQNNQVAYIAEVKKMQRDTELLREQFHITLQSVGDGLIVTDSNEYVTLMNPAAERILGVAEGELLGHPLEEAFQIVRCEDGSSVVRPTLQVLQRGKAVADTEPHELINRNHVHYRITESASPIGSEYGELTGAVMVFRDVTQVYKQQLHLEDMLHTLQGAVHLAKISYFQCNAQGRVWTPGGFAGTEWRNGGPMAVEDLVHPSDLEIVREAWREMLAKHLKLQVCAFRSKDADQGVPRYCRMMVLRNERKIDSDGDLFQCVLQDITEMDADRRTLAEQKELLETVIEVLPGMFFVKDADHDFRFMFSNRQHAEAWGLSKERILGATDLDISPAAEAEKFRKDDEMVIRSTTPIVLEETMPSMHGVLQLRTFKTALRTSSGKTLLIGLSFRIDEFVATRQKAQENERILQAVIEHAPFGIFLKDIDDDYRYLVWNRKLEEYTGASEATMVGKNDFELEVYPGLNGYFRTQDDEVTASGVMLAKDETRVNPDGTQSVYHMSKLPIFLESGKRYLLGIFVDCTLEKKMAGELQARASMQGNFLSTEQIYNGCLQAIISEPDFTVAVQHALQIIGEHSGADRCEIVCLRTAENFTDRNWQWCAEGVKSQLSFWSEVPRERCIAMLDAMENKPAILLNGKGEYREFFKFLAQCDHHGVFDVKSMLMIPICTSDAKIWGVMCLSSVVHDKAFADSATAEMLGNCVRMFTLSRKHALQQLQLNASKHVQNMIFYNIKVPIMLFDAQAHLVNINPAAAALAGKSERHILQEPCYHSFCGESQVPDYCPVRQVMNGGKATHCEISCLGRDVLIEAEPIFDATGKLLYILENAVDMSDVKETQRRLTSAMHSALAADRAKSNFIATMNHELRTPLNSVIGFSDLLQNEKIGEKEQLDYLHSINLAGKQLLDLVNDILLLSDLDAGKVRIHPHLCNLQELFQEWSQEFQQQSEKHGVAFHLVLPKLLPGVFCDSERLHQMVGKLMDNAFKFTSIGSVKLTVQLELEQPEQGTLCLQVEDTGIGIPDAFLPRIFEPFAQDEGVRGSRAYQGSGLGLAIAQRLVKAMNGEIRVESCENVGSTFRVFLKEMPLERPFDVGSTLDGKVLEPGNGSGD